MTDSSNLTRIIAEVQPDEVYNLGAQSHVAVSFESPEYTADVDGMGTVRLLDEYSGESVPGIPGESVPPIPWQSVPLFSGQICC